jgi:hypothetical protein
MDIKRQREARQHDLRLLRDRITHKESYLKGLYSLTNSVSSDSFNKVTMRQIAYTEAEIDNMRISETQFMKELEAMTADE